MRPDSSLALLRSQHDRISQDIHIGMLVPWANTVVETELPRLGLDRVVFHYARLVPPSRSTALDASFLNGLVAAVPDAAGQLERLPLTAVMMACTSAGFAVADARPTVVVTAFDALVATLRLLRARRIVLATPYPDAVTTREAEAFAEVGIAVTAAAGLGRDDGYATVTADEIRALVDRFTTAALAEADVVVLSCTGWPTLALVAELEAATGRPVLTSNLALASYSIAHAHAREVA
jgi:maleate isomerase